MAEAGPTHEPLAATAHNSEIRPELSFSPPRHSTRKPRYSHADRQEPPFDSPTSASVSVAGLGYAPWWQRSRVSAEACPGPSRDKYSPSRVMAWRGPPWRTRHSAGGGQEGSEAEPGGDG
eukprot:scaffold7694_cov430-Prasinococcus_capsulatus_cf.AAC.1